MDSLIRISFSYNIIQLFTIVSDHPFNTDLSVYLSKLLHIHIADISIVISFQMAMVNIAKTESPNDFSRVNTTPTPTNCSTDFFKCFNNLMQRRITNDSKSCVGHEYYDSSRGQCLKCSRSCPA